MPAEVTQIEGQVDADQLATTTPDTAQAAPTGAQGEQDAPKGEEKSGESAAPKTPLEAAKRVMAKGTNASPETKSQTEQQTPKPETKVEGEDDDASLPFKDHPTYRKVKSENRILKVAQTKNEAAIKDLEPKARTYDDLSGFIRDSNLSKDDFASGLTIMKAIRNDPAKGLELLGPIVERLQAEVGVRLSPELQAQVSAGQITLEVAQELSRARGGERLARAQVEARDERAARDAEARRADDEKAQLDTVVNTINAAEREWRARDPDATKLGPLLEDRLLAVGGMNPPRSAEEARKLFDDCLKHVRAQASGFRPTPIAKDGALPASGNSTLSTTPIPKSSLDAAKAALASAG